MLKSFTSWKEINENLISVSPDVKNLSTGSVYTLQTNNTTYLLEYDAEDDIVYAEVKEGSGPDGAFEYLNETLVFYPEISNSERINITNELDKKFFSQLLNSK